jgi:hypothetical protein
VQSSSQPPRSVLEANVAGTGFNLNAGISEFYWVRGYLIVIREVKRIVTWSVWPSAKLMYKSSGYF